MSVLFRVFANISRRNLPRFFNKSSIQSITAMEVVTEENKESHNMVLNKNCTRFKKRQMKRQWEEFDKNKKDSDETEEKKMCERTVERIKRKKMVLLLGYCGVDYYGMQRNPGVRTIEEDLLKALWEAKYITEEDFNNQQNTQFQRSSRTDKGVSAARQVVSLKLPLEVDIEEINKRLPDCIKVFSVKRVTNKFNSKGKCNARTYSYTLPTYVFEPSLTSVEERRQYRITPEKMEEVNNLLGIYKGTKCYYNFTEKKHFQDPSASRYMMGFSIEKTFLESNMEFAVLLVKGQSFMLHQIRKMIGLVIAVIRGMVDKSIMEKAFSKEKVMIPTAPGLGLVLDMVHYDRYDARYKESHASLTWETEEEMVQKFKHEHIFPVIVKGEVEGNSMGIWLDEKLVKHSFEPSEDAPGEKGTETEEKEIGGGDDDEDDLQIDNDDENVNNEAKKIDIDVKNNDRQIGDDTKKDDNKNVHNSDSKNSESEKVL